VHWTSAGFAHTFGDSAPTADSASGGFVRQIPRLPVTPAVETVEKVPFQKHMVWKWEKTTEKHLVFGHFGQRFGDF
jgi:hypothetical protein